MTIRVLASLSTLVLCLFVSDLHAQAVATTTSKPFEITDNSFLVEEAFNQEPRVFQNIATWTRGEDGGWVAGFTQEWPLVSQRHQLSYTAGAAHSSDGTHFSALLVNYRYQLLNEGPGRPAFSPRVSVILPTGPSGTSEDSTGVQINLPFSKQHGDLYFHWNAGVTWLPSVATGVESDGAVSLTSPQLAGSVIWRVAPMFHLMLESVVLFAQSVDAGETSRANAFTLSPGFRKGWNLGDQQIVAGIALPYTRSKSENFIAVLTYFSYELPF